MSVMEIRINQEELDKVIRFWPRMTKFEMADAFDHISRRFLSLLRKERLRGLPGIKATPRGLFKEFRRASIYSPTVTGMGIEIFSDSEIALRHQQGETVKAKSGRLAVPLTSAKRASINKDIFTKQGRVRKRFKDDMSNIKRSFVIKSGKNKKEILFRRKKGAKNLQPLFVFQDSVDVPPRLEFFNVWDSLLQFRIQRINKAINKVVERL